MNRTAMPSFLPCIKILKENESASMRNTRLDWKQRQNGCSEKLIEIMIFHL